MNNKRLLLAGMVAFTLMSTAYSAEPQALWTSHGGSQGTAAAFTDLSNFTANPPIGNTVFNFDLEMRQSITTRDAQGDFSVYVNSKDGSMVITDPNFVRLATKGRYSPQGMEFRFFIIGAEGGNLLCGEDVTYGKLCIAPGEEAAEGSRYERDYLSVTTFFNDIANTPQDVLTDVLISPTGAPSLTQVRSQFGFSDFKTTLWYDKNPSPIKTEWPMLGYGVGLIKDYTTLTNRVIAHSVDEEESGNAAYHLHGIYPSTLSIDTRQYYIASHVGDPATQTEMEELAAWVINKKREVSLLQSRKQAECLPGADGTRCRDEFDRIIKQREDAIQAHIDAVWAQSADDGGFLTRGQFMDMLDKLLDRDSE